MHILVTGPANSGKTIFAKELVIQQTDNYDLYDDILDEKDVTQILDNTKNAIVVSQLMHDYFDKIYYHHGNHIFADTPPINDEGCCECMHKHSFNFAKSDY